MIRITIDDWWNFDTFYIDLHTKLNRSRSGSAAVIELPDYPHRVFYTGARLEVVSVERVREWRTRREDAGIRILWRRGVRTGGKVSQSSKMGWHSATIGYGGTQAIKLHGYSSRELLKTTSKKKASKDYGLRQMRFSDRTWNRNMYNELDCTIK